MAWGPADIDTLLHEKVMDLQSRVGGLEVGLEHLHECAHDQRDRLDEMRELLQEMKLEVMNKRKPLMLGAGSGVSAVALFEFLKLIFAPRA